MTAFTAKTLIRFTFRNLAPVNRHWNHFENQKTDLYEIRPFFLIKIRHFFYNNFILLLWSKSPFWFFLFDQIDFFIEMLLFNLKHNFFFQYDSLLFFRVFVDFMFFRPHVMFFDFFSSSDFSTRNSRNSDWWKRMISEKWCLWSH